MNRNEIRIKPQDGIFRKMGIKNVDVTEIIFYERNKKMRFKCCVPSVNELNELDVIYENIKKNFGKELEVDFNVDFTEKDIRKEQLIEIVERAIIRLKARNAISKSFLYLYRIGIEDENINITLAEQSAIDILKSSQIDEKLETILENFGIYNFKVRFLLGDFSQEVSKIEEEKQKDIITLSAKIDMENQKNANKSKVQEVVVKSATFSKGSFSANKTKEIKGSSISLEEFFELYDDDTCVVEGEIFGMESRDIKNDRVILTIRITDNHTSLTTKIFLEKDKPLEIKVGDYVKISGKKQTDRFSDNEEIMMINSINKLDREKEKKEDKSELKMVELHTHSKMSEMVGVTDISDIIKQAIAYGHSAVAITDYSVVHAFPFAYKAAKGKDIKPILGCEMYMVDDSAEMVRSCKDSDILEEYFVVFDLETMGLNSHEHEIIEIGAVKLQGNRIIDRYSQLVNPQKAIPKKIQELTNITQDMVDNMPTIEEVLPKFMEFVGDATMVAHNAAFDMGFIRRDVKRILGYDYTPAVIDTLQMARDLYPDLKSFGLKNLNKVLGLSLESHHRAVDDSQATANMFIIFMERYLEKGIKSLNEITGAFPINLKKQDTHKI